MARCIAFHSYKGGTGKTTLASNLAALLAKKGHRVFLLDLDVYAPSIQAYFDTTPEFWVNDYLNNEAEVDDVMNDFTHLISESDPSKAPGKLWVGFSNPKKEEIYKLEGITQKNLKSQLFRRFVQLREKLISDYDVDYIIIDTSPGIRFWSISALAISDTYFLALKMGDMDISGTKSMATELYDSLTRYGAKPFLLLNKTAGYCMPDSGLIAPSSRVVLASRQELDVASALSRQLGIEVISSIPCYCDIQFSKKEFLTVLKYPDHPFARQIDELAESSRIKL
ncbi:MAG: AAA family ATPase [Nitrososphaera sp.]|uniref:MinD/ParA family ATP-binding protein n=1 Tax=Nitrososphaera sp. TaxID=1971748 RepID=UPI003D6FD55F